MIHSLLALFIALPLLIISFTILSNWAFFLRLTSNNKTAKEPRVSILIPARNEAEVIGRTVSQLLNQDYTQFELILLDDQSEDHTASIALKTAHNDPRFQVISGQPLPAGWLGKNWACQQLAAQANGEILLFLDADVQCQPQALSALVHMMAQQQADLLTVWPTQQTETWGERLVVPLMNFAIWGYLPILPVHHTASPAFSAANGQCLAFRRSAYDAIGQHEAVRDNVIEDVALAKQIKTDGFRLRMTAGNHLIACKMYNNWAQVRNGFAKNILAGHGFSLPFLALSTLFHWLVFIVPWLWFGITGNPTALFLGVWGIVARGITAVCTHQRLLPDSLLMPISVLLMTRIAIQSVWWHWRGQTQWKGRIVTT